MNSDRPPHGSEAYMSAVSSAMSSESLKPVMSSGQRKESSLSCEAAWLSR